MAAYAGRDSSRAQRLGFWAATHGQVTLFELSDDDIFSALEGLASRRGRYFSGKDADGKAILKAKRTPLSAATINRYQAALTAVLTWAGRRRMTPKGWQNPCKLIELRAERNEIVRFLSDDERTPLLAACRRSSWPRLYLLVLLALTTGARRGELEALRWGDVDLERAEATVHRSKNGDKKVLPLVPAVVEEMRSFVGVSSALLFPSERRPDVAYSFNPSWERALAVMAIDGCIIRRLQQAHSAWEHFLREPRGCVRPATLDIRVCARTARQASTGKTAWCWGRERVSASLAALRVRDALH